MTTIKKTTLYIKGMHCPSCDILVKDSFKDVKGIQDVKANFRNQTAEVCYVGTLPKEELNKKITQFGYSISEKGSIEEKEPFLKKITEIGTLSIILFIVYYFAQELNVLPSFNTSAGSGLTYMTVFILGLVASTSTCMATSGALFLATIGKLNKEKSSPSESIIPALSFNIGRILSYGFFGFIVGFIGQTFASTFNIGSYLTLIISFMMVLIGLDMLKLVSFSSLMGTSVTKGIYENLQARLIANPKKTAFFLGAITYLLPCGFTQSVQFYALGLANPVQSAVIMIIFAIGTVPALLAIGYVSSFTKSAYYPLFTKAMGLIVLVIGLSYLNNFAVLRGFGVSSLAATSTPSTSQNVIVKSDVQEVYMSVNAGGYTPNAFTIEKDKKVKWIIKGENVFGCQSFLQAPKLSINKTIQLGENIIEFTPTETGIINFSCSMGMFVGSFNVIDKKLSML